MQGKEILDVGAGTGRIALPLARRGVRVTCVEPSPAMIAQLQAKLDDEPELGEAITIVPGDAASFDMGRRFPAAMLSGSFDHLLTDDERLRALRNVARHLQPGGVLVFDAFLGLMENTPLSPAGCVQLEGAEYRRFVSTRVQPGRTIQVLLVYEIYRHGRLVERIEQPSTAGLTTRGDVHRLPDLSGLEVRHEFSDYQCTPCRGGDDLLVIEAVRAA